MDGEEVRRFESGGASEEAPARAEEVALWKTSVTDSRVQL